MHKGTKANITGNQLEVTLQTVLLGKGFEIVNYSTWKKNPDKFGKELLLKNVPFRSIYKHDAYTEFLLRSEKYFLEMRIECKWQQLSGSVDEKLPYLYLNTIEAMPEKTIMVLIDGDGWKRGAIKWLREAAKKKKYTTKSSKRKQIMIFSMTEFFTWANNTFV